MVCCQNCGEEVNIIVVCRRCGSRGCMGCFVDGLCKDCFIVGNESGFVQDYENEKKESFV